MHKLHKPQTTISNERIPFTILHKTYGLGLLQLLLINCSKTDTFATYAVQVPRTKLYPKKCTRLT